MRTSRCTLLITGQVAGFVLNLLRDRFDRVVSREADGHTVLVVEGLDQAADRALLTLLWDSGHEVVSMTLTECPP